MRFILAFLAILIPAILLAQQTNTVGFIQHAGWTSTTAVGAASTVLLKASSGATQRNYITDISISATSVNAGTLKIIQGTKTTTDCDTNAADLTPPYNLTSSAGATPQVNFTTSMPVIPIAGRQLCGVSAGASATYSVTLRGYTGP